LKFISLLPRDRFVVVTLLALFDLPTPTSLSKNFSRKTTMQEDVPCALLFGDAQVQPVWK
jgi:hypothetical protein